MQQRQSSEFENWTCKVRAESPKTTRHAKSELRAPQNTSRHDMLSQSSTFVILIFVGVLHSFSDFSRLSLRTGGLSTVGGQHDGNEWKKYRAVPHTHPSRPLVYTYFNRSGSKGGFWPSRGDVGSFLLCGGTFARSYSV